MFLNGGSYVAQACPGLCHPYADVAAFARHFHQTLSFCADFANEEHSRGIGEISFIYCGNVYVDDVATLQVFPRVGDTVADNVVDADAYALGESFVEEGGGDGVVVGGEAVDEVVYIGRGHAFADIRGHVIQQGGVDLGALSDAGQLFGSAEQVALGQADALFLVLLNPCFYLVGVSLGGEALGVYELLHVCFFIMSVIECAKVRICAEKKVKKGVEIVGSSF